MIAVAIDGPAGAGKSTLSRKLAEAIHFIYVDTGALYRAVALFVRRAGISPEETEKVVACLGSLSVDLRYVGGEQRVLLGGEDVSALIRTPEISMAASRVSAIKEVRAFLLELQRDLARRSNVVMDGRDIGTVVLPGAQIKIFLTASPEDRARRRYEELAAKGTLVSYEEVLSDVVKRDYDDSHRAVAPLKPAEDATVLDTTGNEFEQSLRLLTEYVKEQLGL